VSAHVSALNGPTLARLETLTRGFVHTGLDYASAKSAALLALSGGVARQAMVLAFEKVFLLSGCMFVCIVPLLIFLKKPANASRSPGELPH
jgi:hypothetical protein